MIGPALLNGRSPYGPVTIPELLEEGGTVPVREADGLMRLVTYAPRPYMHPAFEEEKKNLPDLWRDSVRRAG